MLLAHALEMPNEVGFHEDRHHQARDTNELLPHGKQPS